MSKIELIKMLKEGDEFNIYKGDVETFKWMVNHGLPSVGLKLGGGNLTVALISVTALSLLAKCYVKLNGSQRYTSCSKMLEKQKGRKLTDKDINESDAFIQMVKDLDCLWGYKQQEVEEFWRRVRHKLVHSAYPKDTIFPPYFTDRPNKPFDVTPVNCTV